MYTPNNVPIYLAAFAGALAGLGAAGKYLSDPNQGDYGLQAVSADAFAQQLDTAWGANPYTSLDLDEIEENSEAIWEGRSPLPTAAASVPGNYAGLVNGVIALARAGTAQVVAEGIDPNGGTLASAEITLTDNVTATVLTSQNTFYPVAGAWAHDIAPENCAINSNGRITSQVRGRFMTLCTISFTSGAAPEQIVFQLFKNGTPIPDHKAITWTDTALFPNTVPITGLDDLVPGDVIDMRIECTTAAGISVTVTDCNFSISAAMTQPH